MIGGPITLFEHVFGVVSTLAWSGRAGSPAQDKGLPHQNAQVKGWLSSCGLAVLAKFGCVYLCERCFVAHNGPQSPCALVGVFAANRVALEEADALFDLLK